MAPYFIMALDSRQFVFVETHICDGKEFRYWTVDIRA